MKKVNYLARPKRHRNAVRVWRSPGQPPSAQGKYYVNAGTSFPHFDEKLLCTGSGNGERGGGQSGLRAKTQASW